MNIIFNDIFDFIWILIWICIEPILVILTQHRIKKSQPVSLFAFLTKLFFKEKSMIYIYTHFHIIDKRVSVSN